MARAAVVTGGFKLGMITARPNWRAVCGNTADKASASRKCKCQSSGRVRVSSVGSDMVRSGSKGQAPSVLQNFA